MSAREMSVMYNLVPLKKKMARLPAFVQQEIWLKLLVETLRALLH